MLNTAEFIDRLQELMAQKQLSAAAFATQIGVQRSSVSHILAQRNKPSLEFVLKIHDAFDDIDLAWLLLGEKTVAAKNPIPSQTATNSSNATDFKMDTPDPIESTSSHTKENPLEIEAVITLFKDGRFKKYSPNS